MVAEVQSPSSRDRDLGRKRKIYLGARLTYVTVDPAERQILVHTDTHDLDVDALAAPLGWPPVRDDQVLPTDQE